MFMKRNKNISIQQFTDPEYERLVNLSKTTYNGREISDTIYLQWEYNLNPDGTALITIAEAQNKIVSQYLILPRKYSIDNKIFMGSLSVNTLTHPDFRGIGLFTKLSNETFKLCKENEILFTI